MADCKVYCEYFFSKKKEAKAMAQRSMFRNTVGKYTVVTRL